MTPNKPPAGRQPRVVDLHLKPGYNQGDAVERQLARVRGEMDSAIRAGAAEIVFIHGVGIGKLKDEIRRIIAEDYPSCSYQDAPFSRFGVGGATLIVILHR
jgi:dsDNA-specific endonuclease/ATPase MutS2